MGTLSFFEGSEKKLEIVLAKSCPSLLLKERDFFYQLVEKAKAKVLSEISSEGARAYLLSESSLFVWDDHITMITCGQTTLESAALFFLESFHPDDIASLIYERKNEYLPQKQQSDFDYDIRKLKAKVSGKAFRFGNLDEHHLFLFHMDKDFEPPNSDTTLELLMYDLDDEVLRLFRDPHITREVLRKTLRIEEMFPEFTIDDYLFTPFGYSLNALDGENYFTIHVTPQEPGCYVSFEVSLERAKDYQSISNKVIEIFRPHSFDIIHFQPQKCESIQMEGFQQRSVVEQQLSCGYGVYYSHLFKPPTSARSAYLFEED